MFPLSRSAVVPCLVAAALVAAGPPPFSGTSLFPIPIDKGWTTAPESILQNVPKSVLRLSLKDNATIGMGDAYRPPKFGTPPDGSDIDAHHAFYPAGSFSKSTDPGGFGFSLTGPLEQVDITAADQVLFSFAVYFEAGFDFVMGGKMPGLEGGTNRSAAGQCSGGDTGEIRNHCWSTRFMWRTGGAGEVYFYLPTSVATNFPAMYQLEGSEADPQPEKYGFSLARGTFTFPTGKWIVLAQRVQLNHVGKADGEIEVWVDGKSVIHATGLTIALEATNRVRGVMANTFFGGSNSSWQSPRDQNSWVAAYSMATLKAGASAAEGKAIYPVNTHPPNNTNTTGGNGGKGHSPDAAFSRAIASTTVVVVAAALAALL